MTHDGTRQADGEHKNATIDTWLERLGGLPMEQAVLDAVKNNLKGTVLNEERLIEDLVGIAEPEAEFSVIYPGYAPSSGMRGFLVQNRSCHCEKQEVE